MKTDKKKKRAEQIEAVSTSLQLVTALIFVVLNL